MTQTLSGFKAVASQLSPSGLSNSSFHQACFIIKLSSLQPPFLMTVLSVVTEWEKIPDILGDPHSPMDSYLSVVSTLAFPSTLSTQKDK